jgi:hypothetical protein
MPPAIVNQALARALFPGASAVGQQVRTTATDCTKPLGSLMIVGVVGDSRVDLRGQMTAALFFPLGAFQGPVTLIVRTVGDPGSMIPTVRRAMTELNANTPTFSEAPVTELVERRLRRERFLATLLSVFATITVFICCLGIYGMLSFAVERRRQEISVRMAIGAQLVGGDHGAVNLREVAAGAGGEQARERAHRSPGRDRGAGRAAQDCVWQQNLLIHLADDILRKALFQARSSERKYLNPDIKNV